MLGPPFLFFPLTPTQICMWMQIHKLVTGSSRCLQLASWVTPCLPPPPRRGLRPTRG